MTRKSSCVEKSFGSNFHFAVLKIRTLRSHSTNSVISQSNFSRNECLTDSTAMGGLTLNGEDIRSPITTSAGNE